MLCSTLSTSSSSSRASMISMFFSKSSSVHSTGAFGTYARLILAVSCPIPLTASSIRLASFGSEYTILVPSASPPTSSMSSHPASIAAIMSSPSSRAASTSTLPLRSYMKRTLPGSATFPLRLPTVDLTSAVARLALSDRTLMTKDAPPRPYASKVDSEKSPTLASDARLMARLMLSTGTLADFACLMTSARARFAFGSGEPPCLMAMMIFLP
mmetsp:Transcript_106076/g.300110  ORF Transcript_106076/g.300110 Transcript_106076/m.300110 type:complete len:213 (+) Transcript_106076:158-796(+)